ncbi:putative type VI secretion system effector [Serratia sp. DD3]|uniref:putative type VI secretion system effector n=1 Tax=Serratia sp. DD3 TaxID=1410619 RepID=UPI0003C4EDC6|nr:putative type VI secretion system effector [Serratia sp. DD3]KEY59308.1 hypothetical protein SRDD_15880 [Serratia sp. DD3]
MEKETDSDLYNYTSCLRNEYKDPVRLWSCLESLKIYYKSCEESITEYDTNPQTPIELESDKETHWRKYIDEMRFSMIRAQQYIKQVEEERDNFPLHPELPPTKPLIKISGILEEVSFKKVIGYFAYTEYSTEKQRAEEKLKRDNSGAVLVAVLSAFANSTAPNLLKDGKKKEYQCLYVKGNIGGKSFSGWLNKTDIKVGDYLEMAVMPDGDEYKMYAVANPEQQTISTTPECNAGSRWFTAKSLIKFSAIFFAFIIYLPSLFASLTLKDWCYALLIHVALTGALSFTLYRIYVNENRAPGDLFEKICAALNIPNGNNLALEIYTKDLIKEKEKKGKWLEKKDKITVMPQRKNRPDYDFYFYPSDKKSN